MNKPRRYTWEEWQKELDEAMKGEWYYTETHIQEAIEANEPLIEWQEKRIAELEEICRSADIEVSVFKENKTLNHCLDKAIEALEELEQYTSDYAASKAIQEIKAMRDK